MASLRKSFHTVARPHEVWDAVQDIGALATRLVPGFVVETRLEEGARIVTFANGAVVREPIVSLDPEERRLVWSAQGGLTTHYNAALQVLEASGGGCEVVWTVDFLPDSAKVAIGGAMEAAFRAMKPTLDRLG